MQRSVFDVSADILRISGVESMDALKLQQLVYYFFGWYAYVTGRRLFDQQFCAVEHGPTVTDLLALHAYTKDVSLDCIENGRAALEDTYAELEPDTIYSAVLSSVVAEYGELTGWELKELTCGEKPWRDSWDSRLREAQSCMLRQSDIMAFFMTRDDAPASMPDPLVTILPDDVFEHLDKIAARGAMDGVEHMRAAVKAYS